VAVAPMSDPTFYRSPAQAMEAPPETLAYVVTFDREGKVPDRLGVLDTDPRSSRYGQVVGGLEMPNVGDELHHFGWNACSAALCPHHAPAERMERRYLIIPGLRSSRIHVVDTKPDPRAPRLVKVIEPEELASRTGYSRPHTSHCGDDGIYMSALGNPEGDGPGGIFVIDNQTFDVKGPWEMERGPQYLAYDFWWHLGRDTLISSEWGTPRMIENGLDPELLLASKYGHQIHVWDLAERRHRQAIDIGAQYQMTLELRPAHDPNRAYGFMGVVVSLEDLSASVWLWDLRDGTCAVEKVIDIPAEPADPELLPPMLKGFKAVPPLVTDINLSVDDRFLYVSCWGTGEMRQYDVTDPRHPRLTGSVCLGGIVRRAAHPSSGPLNGGPQMVEVSRDGRRVYVSNSLYGAWDDQFYPEGLRSWVAKLDASPEGGLEPDPDFFPEFEQRTHQIHLEGGDASSDSYWFS
jgi:selenium-binding protein 1